MAQFINKYITRNPYYNDKKWITGDDLEGFMLHSVGVGQPDPLVFIRAWDNPNYTNAGINGFIGDSVAYITAPCLEKAGQVKRMPHAGKRWCNDHYIGFEMCEPGQLKYTTGANFTCSNYATARAYVQKTYDNAVALFAELCTLHGKDPLKPGVIISHNEGGKQGIASGHVDPEHLWRGLGMNLTMDGFRQDVYNKMHGIFDEEDEDMTQEKFNEMMNNYRKSLQDNDCGTWSKADRDWCVANGLIKGTGQTINGEQNYAWADFLTREQAAALFHRFADMVGK